MSFLSDIEIARNARPSQITAVASELGIPEDFLDLYGTYKAKVDLGALKLKKEHGKLILVTAISPTPLGEGKTTTTVGLGDALRKLGKKAVIALREPSLGPVFGMKGGACGGGYAQVIPMEDINMHFTGDIHAIGAANNLLAAMIDNHIHHGNALNIDSRRITWKRCMDMNDRQLRAIVSGLSGVANGVPREDGFDITVASEVMAVLCLSESYEVLKNNLKNIVIGFDRNNAPVTAEKLQAHGAMAALLKDALKPNLAQTLEGTPAFVHGGPFANIAHGCNSVTATRLAISLGDYAITEAGFGADLGAEKFFNIKCRKAGITPSAVVIVATVRALKHHGGGSLEDGMPNLIRHIENITENFGLKAVVAINMFPEDTLSEIELVKEQCRAHGVEAVLSQVWEKGGEGGLELAERVVSICHNADNNSFKLLYQDQLSLKEKIVTIAKQIYRAQSVEFSPVAIKQLARFTTLGFGALPVCMAKTQYSFSDDPKKLGAPNDFTLFVRSIRLAAGAGFVVALTGDIMTLPGLPKTPAAEKITIDSNGQIHGLF